MVAGGEVGIQSFRGRGRKRRLQESMTENVAKSSATFTTCSLA